MDETDRIDDALPRRRSVGTPSGDATLPFRCSLSLLPPRPMARLIDGTGLRGRREPSEEREALRRCVRFVWTAETSVGVAGRARRAAAAAADERLYAETAAVAALGLTVAAVSG